MLHRMKILNITHQKNPKNATPKFLIVSMKDPLRHPDPPPQLPPQIQVSHSTKICE